MTMTAYLCMGRENQSLFPYQPNNQPTTPHYTEFFDVSTGVLAVSNLGGTDLPLLPAPAILPQSSKKATRKRNQRRKAPAFSPLRLPPITSNIIKRFNHFIKSAGLPLLPRNSCHWAFLPTTSSSQQPKNNHHQLTESSQ